MFVLVSTSFAAVVSVDGNNSKVVVNDSSTINDALTDINNNEDGNGTIYLNNDKYDGSSNTKITLGPNRNITIIGNGTSPNGTILIVLIVIGL